jgi:hypothetical protein
VAEELVKGLGLLNGGGAVELVPGGLLNAQPETAAAAAAAAAAATNLMICCTL